MTSTIGLQAIIGTDKHNPYISLYHHVEKKQYHFYYGACLMEILPDKIDSPQIKHLVGRLYNAHISPKKLVEIFGYSFHTIQHWGKTIQTGDLEAIVKCFERQGAPRKLTKEIESFIRHSFKRVYTETKRHYSEKIRKEIKEIFHIEISSETLRPLFGELKAAYRKKEEERQRELKKNHSIND